MEIIKFDKNIAELEAIVEITKQITVDDLNDPTQLELVKENRKELRRLEISIEEQGKAMRDNANKYAKDVIAREKELKAITTPEIDRLKGIEQQAKDMQIREERLKDLPLKKEKLATIGDSIEITDDELLKLDYDQFMQYYNQRIVNKVETDKINLEVEKRKLEDVKKGIERAKEMEEAKEKTRIETEKRMKEKQALAEKEAKAKAERLEKEKIEAEKKKAEELTKQKEYQEFLAKYGYTEETKDDFILEKTGDKIRLAKILGIFTLFSK